MKSLLGANRLAKFCTTSARLQGKTKEALSAADAPVYTMAAAVPLFQTAPKQHALYRFYPHREREGKPPLAFGNFLYGRLRCALYIISKRTAKIKMRNS